MTVRQHLLRLFISTDEKVKGDVFIYYANGSHYMKEHGAKFLRKLKLGCENFRRGTHLDVCAATFRLSPDWHEIYNNLNSLGIKTLPDQSELPGAEIYVTDGTSVVIEVRDGARYRSYEYSNPSVRSEPEASRASEIIRIVENLVSQTNGT